MSRTVALQLQIALACCIGLLQLGIASGQPPILMDDFESGVDDAQIPTTGPWRLNDSAPVAEGLTARYRSVSDPFTIGNRYAYLNDPQAASGYGFRLFSTNAADTGGLVAQIDDQVTTFSFEFYEPADVDPVPVQPGMIFGYYYNQPTTGMNPDLNSGGRIYSAALHNGSLTPNSAVAGEFVEYGHELVHTVFMVANDSAADVVGYREGHTVAAGQADIWISLNGANPIYVASVINPNAISERDPGGVGFRAFTNDIEQFLINNVLLVDGASFDRSTFDTPAGQAGDYNGDEVVDAADYTVWRDHLGETFDLPNRNPANTGVISTADYTWWKSHYGTPGSGGLSATTLAVPEPTSALMLLASMFLFSNRLLRWAPANQLLAPTI